MYHIYIYYANNSQIAIANSLHIYYYTLMVLYLYLLKGRAYMPICTTLIDPDYFTCMILVLLFWSLFLSLFADGNLSTLRNVFFSDSKFGTKLPYWGEQTTLSSIRSLTITGQKQLHTLQTNGFTQFTNLSVLNITDVNSFHVSSQTSTTFAYDYVLGTNEWSSTL